MNKKTIFTAGNVFLFQIFIITAQMCSCSNSRREQPRGCDPQPSKTPQQHIQEVKSVKSGEVKTVLPDSDHISLSSKPVNLTLVDDPSLGKAYVLESKRLDFFDSGIEVRFSGKPKEVHVVPKCFTIDFELSPIGKGENFHFDDCEGTYVEVYPSIRKIEWFRVRFPKDETYPHVIRGFDRTGKCVYYKEWSQPIFGAVIEKNSGKTAERRIPVPVPKMHLPLLDE